MKTAVLHLLSFIVVGLYPAWLFSAERVTAAYTSIARVILNLHETITRL